MATKRPTILIVQRCTSDAESIRDLLPESFPRNVHLFCDGGDSIAVDQLRTQKIDCVILDPKISDGSGWRLLDQVRSRVVDLPVIAMSDRGCEREVAQSIKRGAHDYLVLGKTSSQQLRTAIESAIAAVKREQKKEARNRELEEFAQVAAHDLKGPLTTIQTWIEILADGVIGQVDEEARSLLHKVNSNTMQMSELLDSLLAYAQTGRTKTAFKQVNLGDIVDEVIDSLDSTIKEKQALIERSPLPTVLGDPIAIRQLFQNLVANALKFCRNRQPVVNIVASDRGTCWRVSVVDNGIGIAEEDVDTIFRPFHRLHSQSEFEGTGLGLATCQRIISQHSGHIDVESRLGAGTTFHCAFPKIHPNRKYGLRGPRGLDRNLYRLRTRRRLQSSSRSI
ncbi:hybrid sensor histidine kinase/response regulator [Stieleria sp. JC731]|uniref:hybrid sensor histidine kinase/response regulator n=1 Tax=Pirellulaceae TaxID=2691357 RepID=UPI001E58BD2B|nr:hybrid sensor histidine kinase/response regulator [Stieleria sp. JC731]